MNQSEKVDQIAAALVPALGRIRNPKPDAKATVPTKSGAQYSYTYVSLGALAQHVRDVFKDVGLAVSQEVDADSAGVAVTTRIWHLSGQWIELGPLFIPAAGGAQDMGSASTYARRYALAAAVGVAADEDDDGSQAQRARKAPESTQARGGSGTAGPGDRTSPGPVPSSAGGRGGAPVEVGGTGAGEEGEADPVPATPEQATPEQRTRLLKIYGNKPASVKAKAVELFDRFEKIGDVIIGDLTSSEAEALMEAGY